MGDGLSHAAAEEEVPAVYQEVEAEVASLAASHRGNDDVDLHLLDTADHGFRTLKRTRKSTEDVFVEMARIVREWAARLK